MEESILCPYCYTDQNNYKCEKTCHSCNTMYCIICNEPFYIINYQIIKGHLNSCYKKHCAKY